MFKQDGYCVQVGIMTGLMRWSLEVVRPCDMLWMGVSAEFNLDTSQWAAHHERVWMASEESCCLAHISGEAFVDILAKCACKSSLFP